MKSFRPVPDELNSFGCKATNFLIQSRSFFHESNNLPDRARVACMADG